MEYRAIAEKAAEILKEYDYYDFMDNLEIDEGFDDAVDKLERNLYMPQSLEMMSKELIRMYREDDLEPELKAKIYDLVEEVHKGASQEIPNYPDLFELADKFMREEGINRDPLEEAKRYINLYCFCEFENSTADYKDLSKIGVAYTTSEDNQHEIQAYVNLVDFQIEIYIDNFLAKAEKYNSLEEMNQMALPNLDFDDLVYEAQEILYENEEFLENYSSCFDLVSSELFKRGSSATFQDVIDGIKEYESSLVPRFNPEETEGSHEAIATYIQVVNGEEKEEGREWKPLTVQEGLRCKDDLEPGRE